MAVNPEVVSIKTKTDAQQAGIRTYQSLAKFNPDSIRPEYVVQYYTISLEFKKAIDQFTGDSKRSVDFLQSQFFQGDVFNKVKEECFSAGGICQAQCYTLVKAFQDNHKLPVEQLLTILMDKVLWHHVAYFAYELHRRLLGDRGDRWGELRKTLDQWGDLALESEENSEIYLLEGLTENKRLYIYCGWYDEIQHFPNLTVINVENSEHQCANLASDFILFSRNNQIYSFCVLIGIHMIFIYLKDIDLALGYEPASAFFFEGSLSAVLSSMMRRYLNISGESWIMPDTVLAFPEPLVLQNMIVRIISESGVSPKNILDVITDYLHFVSRDGSQNMPTRSIASIEDPSRTYLIVHGAGNNSRPLSRNNLSSVTDNAKEIIRIKQS